MVVPHNEVEYSLQAPVVQRLDNAVQYDLQSLIRWIAFDPLNIRLSTLCATEPGVLSLSSLEMEDSFKMERKFPLFISKGKKEYLCTHNSGSLQSLRRITLNYVTVGRHIEISWFCGRMDSSLCVNKIQIKINTTANHSEGNISMSQWELKVKTSEFLKYKKTKSAFTLGARARCPSTILDGH